MGECTNIYCPKYIKGGCPFHKTCNRRCENCGIEIQQTVKKGVDNERTLCNHAH
jgi:hypothetical protein